MATLQPGSWLIFGAAIGALTTNPQAIAIATSTTAGVGIIASCNITTNASINAQMQMPVTTLRVAAGTTQPLYMHCYNAGGTATGTAFGIAVRIA
jgi:putative hemolysin